MSVVKVKQRVDTRNCITNVFQHCALCGGKASLPIKANTAIGERHETWKGGLSFRKRQLFFLWKCQNLAFYPIQIKWQRFEEEKTKLWNDQKTLQVSTLTHSHSLSCQPHCLPSFLPVYSEISKIKYCHLSPIIF